MTGQNTISYPNIQQSWGIVGIAILCMVLFSPLTFLLKTVAGEELSILVYYVLAMSAAFWFAHRRRQKSMGVSEFAFDPSSVKIVILVSIATVAIQTGITAPLANLLPMPEFIKALFREFATKTGVFSFIAVVIAAPILEELIFRGIILDGLLKRYSPWKAIIVSSVLFGVGHLNPWQFVSAFIVGIFLGWVYYKTKNLTLAILIHFVNNLFAFLPVYFFDIETLMDMSLTEIYGGVSNLVLVIVGAIMVALICVYFMAIEFKKMKISTIVSKTIDSR